MMDFQQHADKRVLHVVGSPSFSIFPNLDDLLFENIYLKNNKEEGKQKGNEEMKKK